MPVALSTRGSAAEFRACSARAPTKITTLVSSSRGKTTPLQSPVSFHNFLRNLSGPSKDFHASTHYAPCGRLSGLSCKRSIIGLIRTGVQANARPEDYSVGPLYTSTASRSGSRRGQGHNAPPTTRVLACCYRRNLNPEVSALRV